MHRAMVAMNGGIQAGMSQWMAFALMAPEFVFFGRYCDMARHIFNGDQKAMEKWSAVNEWYDSPRDLAGVWFLDALENHFTKNKLYEGTWEIYGKKIDLSRITCPVYVFAGGDDDITSVEQTKGILDKVSSKSKQFVLFPEAGHTRVFTGKKELDQFAEIFFNC